MNKSKINEDNYLGLVVENLTLLKDAFADDVIPTMLFDGDDEEKIEELQSLVDYLNKTIDIRTLTSTQKKLLREMV